jgi:hypothetical protein
VHTAIFILVSGTDDLELSVATWLEARREQLASDVLARVAEEMPSLLDEEDRRVGRDAVRSLIVDFATTPHLGAGRFQVRAPAAAVAFPQRLVRRGAALAETLRAYRLGQEIVFGHVMELAREIPDAEQRLATATRLGALSFRYADALARRRRAPV